MEHYSTQAYTVRHSQFELFSTTTICSKLLCINTVILFLLMQRLSIVGCLRLDALKYMVVDWSHRDMKQRKLIDIRETRTDFMDLLRRYIIPHVKMTNCTKFALYWWLITLYSIGIFSYMNVMKSTLSLMYFYCVWDSTS